MKIEKKYNNLSLIGLLDRNGFGKHGHFFGADRHGAQKYPAYEADFGKCPAELT